MVSDLMGILLSVKKLKKFNLVSEMSQQFMKFITGYLDQLEMT